MLKFRLNLLIQKTDFTLQNDISRARSRGHRNFNMKAHSLWQSSVNDNVQRCKGAYFRQSRE